MLLLNKIYLCIHPLSSRISLVLLEGIRQIVACLPLGQGAVNLLKVKVSRVRVYRILRLRIADNPGEGAEALQPGVSGLLPFSGLYEDSMEKNSMLFQDKSICICRLPGYLRRDAGGGGWLAVWVCNPFLNGAAAPSRIYG